MADKKKNATGSGEKKVTIFIPKKNRADVSRFVSVNGRTALIRTGETVEVPLEFAEVIEQSLAADAAAERYVTENSEQDA